MRERLENAACGESDKKACKRCIKNVELNDGDYKDKEKERERERDRERERERERERQKETRKREKDKVCVRRRLFCSFVFLFLNKGH